ncbi:MAG TPA: HWE histidine kinase domain-containing protein [Falsiroseomonas sp.]|nr:HWE histidine kinase domain-containing protein [Falsiroseomonas sp.]
MDSSNKVSAAPDRRRLEEELRLTKVELAESRREAEEAKARAQETERIGGVLANLAAAAPGAFWAADADTGQGVYVSPGAEVLLGAKPVEVLPEAGRWLRLVHPDDRPAVASRFEALQRGEAAEVAYRVLPAGAGEGGAGARPAALWVSDFGFPISDGAGRVWRVAGFARQAEGSAGEEGLRRLLLAELNHRVRNALAAVQSLAAQSARATPDPGAFWEAFAGRLRAMARTHDALAGRGWPDGTDLRGLLEAELAPYLHAAGPAGPQTELDGPPVRLGPAIAVALALAIHELTINAVRHGALLAPAGRVRVRWWCRDAPTNDPAPATAKAVPRLWLEWTEEGGPPLNGPPTRRGFGARLLTSALPTQIAGRVQLDFRPTGLHVVMEAPLPGVDGAVHAPPPTNPATGGGS